MSSLVPAPKPGVFFALFLHLVAVLACGPVRLVSPYDEVLDRGTTALHGKVAGFVGKTAGLAGKPEGSYAANEHVYAELKGEVSSLRARAAAVPQNDITVKLFDELSGNLERLRQLHEMGGEQGLSRAVAGPALAALDVNFTSIVKLEIAKRRGDSE